MKFGIVGLGYIAKKFAEAVNLCEDAQLYAVASRDIKKAEQYKNEYNATKFYDDYDKLFADKEVNIIYIATLNNSHIELSKKAILQGKAVICEKPLGINLQEVEELINLAKEKNVLLMEALWTKHLPAYKQVKNWISEGRIGEITYANFEFSFKAQKSADSRLYDKEKAGGALLDVGCYTIAVALGLFDEFPTEIKSVVKMSETGVDEFTSAILSFKSGKIANLIYGICVDLANDGVIYGNNGKIEMRGRFHRTNDVFLYNSSNTLVDEYHCTQENGFVFEVKEMCELYKNGSTQSNCVSLDDTLKCMKVIDVLQKQQSSLS